MHSSKLLLVITLFFMGTLSYAQTVNNLTELNDAIAGATPGTTIILADGIWNDVFIDINKNGTSAAPITITAQNPGAVLMSGNSRVQMSGEYLTVSGLVFQDPSNLVTSGSSIKPIFDLDECDYCKIINNKIDSYNGTESQKTLTFKWILNDGQHNEIAYNSFIGKYGVGSIINDNRNSSVPDYLKIHHNYFANRTPINELNEDNDQDAIRIGNSSTSLSDSFTEVYDNYFYNFFGEIEVISNKSGSNKYYNNTFRDYSGCLTLRHGDNCEVYGNYFFAEENLMSAGVRVIGEGHKVYNNYIEGVNSIKPDGSKSSATGGINVSNGRLNSELNGYFQVRNTQIVNNTFVNCDYGLRIGTKVKNDLDQEPENLTLANNIMYNTSIDPFQTITTPSGTYVNQGNITDLSNNALVDDGNFYRITSGSAPINAGTGDYIFLTNDILGGNRSAIFDAGAEELGSNGTNLPYSATDVGETIGFGAAIVSSPTLAVVPSTITFSKNAESLTFDIISNVDWTITENLSWLSLDVTSGFGTTTVTATVTENTTGTERSGAIFIDEIAGGDDLSDILPVVQLNTFLPVEIPIIGTTSLGMQIKPEVSEINAYNDDFTNYWTGNPDTAAEVSITFDLSCIHELTEIGIHFWKADERTTFFSIAVSDEPFGPFSTVIETDTSVISTVETEQLFDLSGVFARYVKFIGIGNSSSSNWTSIANVNIYGNLDCEDTTNIFDSQPKESGVTIFPVPVTNGVLNISANSKMLGSIEIYNITGQRVLMANGNRTPSTQIDVTQLNAGIYFVRLEGIGIAKFMVK